MKNTKICMIILASFLVFGCAKTRVVLLPDSEGKVGKVDVTTDSGTRTLDKEYEYTESSSMSSMPKEAGVMAKGEMDVMFGAAMNAMPEKPVSFLLYFRSGTAELTAESLKLIPDVIESIRKREPSEVSIIGHSDTMGTNDYNVRLSLARAESIKQLLVQDGVSISKMEVSSHGEHDLIVKTPDNVSEPKNRRVEVMVR